MITIGTLKLDLVADREPFVHDLYGRWDTFNRTSLEGIVDPDREFRFGSR